MERPTILRFDVLRLMDTGDPFDLVFITADRKRGTGGEIKEVKGYKKITGDSPAAEPRAAGSYQKAAPSKSRNPNHNEHKTLNIFNPQSPDDHPVSVHWRLMIFFNQQRIIG